MGYDVYVQQKPGLRAAYTEAWPHIKGEYVITFSPDGNSPPEYIPELISKIRRDTTWLSAPAILAMPPVRMTT